MKTTTTTATTEINLEISKTNKQNLIISDGNDRSD